MKCELSKRAISILVTDTQAPPVRGRLQQSRTELGPGTDADVRRSVTYWKF